MLETPQLKTVSAEWFHWANDVVFSDLECVRLNCEVRQWRDEKMRAAVLSLTTSILGNKRQRIAVDERWPKNWKEAFKERWFPRWWLRRWPVQYNEVHIDEWKYTRSCPHMGVKIQGPHVMFLCADNFADDAKETYRP